MPSELPPKRRTDTVDAADARAARRNPITPRTPKDLVGLAVDRAATKDGVAGFSYLKELLTSDRVHVREYPDPDTDGIQREPRVMVDPTAPLPEVIAVGQKVEAAQKLIAGEIDDLAGIQTATEEALREGAHLYDAALDETDKERSRVLKRAMTHARAAVKKDTQAERDATDANADLLELQRLVAAKVLPVSFLEGRTPVAAAEPTLPRVQEKNADALFTAESRRKLVRDLPHAVPDFSSDIPTAQPPVADTPPPVNDEPTPVSEAPAGEVPQADVTDPQISRLKNRISDSSLGSPVSVSEIDQGAAHMRDFNQDRSADVDVDATVETVAPTTITILQASTERQRTIHIEIPDGAHDIVAGKQVAQYIGLVFSAGPEGLTTSDIVAAIGTSSANVTNLRKQAQTVLEDFPFRITLHSPYEERVKRISGTHRLELLDTNPAAPTETPAELAAEALDAGQTPLTETAKPDTEQFKNGTNPRALFDALPANHYSDIAGFVDTNSLVARLGYASHAELKSDIEIINDAIAEDGYRVVVLSTKHHTPVVFIEQTRPIAGEVTVLGDRARSGDKELQFGELEQYVLSGLDGPILADTLEKKNEARLLAEGRRLPDVIAALNTDLGVLTGVENTIALKGNDEIGYFYEIEGVKAAILKEFSPVMPNSLNALNAFLDGESAETITALLGEWKGSPESKYRFMRISAVRLLNRGRHGTNDADNEAAVYAKLESHLKNREIDEVGFLTDLASRLDIPHEDVRPDDLSAILHSPEEFHGEFTRIERSDVAAPTPSEKTDGDLKEKGIFVFPGETEAEGISGITATLLHELAPDGVFNDYANVEHIVTSGQLRELTGLKSDSELRFELKKVKAAFKERGYRLGFIYRREGQEINSGVYVEKEREAHGEISMKGDLLRYGDKEIQLTTEEYQLFNRLQGAVDEEKLIRKQRLPRDPRDGSADLADQIDRLETKLQALTGEPVIMTGGNDQFGYFFEIKGFKTSRELSYLPTFPSRLDALQAYVNGEHDREALIDILGNTRPATPTEAGVKLTVNQAAEALRLTIIRLEARNAAGMATDREKELQQALENLRETRDLKTTSLLVELGKTFGLTKSAFRVDATIEEIGIARLEHHKTGFERIELPSEVKRPERELTPGVEATIGSTEQGYPGFDLTAITREVTARTISLANQTTVGLGKNAYRIPNLPGMISAEFGTLYPNMPEELREQVFHIAQQTHMRIIGETIQRRGKRQ
jgi:hypothetical protein